MDKEALEDKTLDPDSENDKIFNEEEGMKDNIEDVSKEGDLSPGILIAL